MMVCSGVYIKSQLLKPIGAFIELEEIRNIEFEGDYYFRFVDYYRRRWWRPMGVREKIRDGKSDG
jgi:hypothetical protein